MSRVRGWAPLAAALLVLLAGCGAGTVEVRATDGSAQLGKGQVLRVDLGAVNPSIGDAWYLTGAPDPAVLAEKGRDYRSDCGAGQAGCGGRLAWEFTARGKGSTTVAFRYCYRSGPDRCDPGPGRGPADPVRVTVTVR